MKYFDSQLETKIESYCNQNSTPTYDYLVELERITNLNTTSPRMLSGWEQGRLLAFISKMIRPQQILEIGTFTGYSALCLAEGLDKGGKLTSLDINEEWNEIAKTFIAKSPFKNQIDLIISDAGDFLQSDDNKYDLVFIDADKESYPKYFDMTIDKLNLGGFILADNVLWSGKVIEENPDKTTKIIKAFNEKVLKDDRVENFILPIRDGINIMRKVK